MGPWPSAVSSKASSQGRWLSLLPSTDDGCHQFPPRRCGCRRAHSPAGFSPQPASFGSTPGIWPGRSSQIPAPSFPRHLLPPARSSRSKPQPHRAAAPRRGRRGCTGTPGHTGSAGQTQKINPAQAQHHGSHVRRFSLCSFLFASRCCFTAEPPGRPGAKRPKPRRQPQGRAGRARSAPGREHRPRLRAVPEGPRFPVLPARPSRRASRGRHSEHCCQLSRETPPGPGPALLPAAGGWSTVLHQARAAGRAPAHARLQKLHPPVFSNGWVWAQEPDTSSTFCLCFFSPLKHDSLHPHTTA